MANGTINFVLPEEFVQANIIVRLKDKGQDTDSIKGLVQSGTMFTLVWWSGGEVISWCLDMVSLNHHWHHSCSVIGSREST